MLNSSLLNPAAVIMYLYLLSLTKYLAMFELFLPGDIDCGIGSFRLTYK
jgi:hypothetical protein